MVDIQFVKASDYCESVVDGTHDSPKPCDEGFYLITSKHLLDYEINFASAYKISEADYNLITKRSSVKQWDILLSMIGTVGRVYIERNSNSEYACKNVGIFKCGGDRYKALWLYYVLKSPYCKQYISKVLAGSTQSYISLGNLRAFPVPVIADEKRNRIIEALSTLDDKIEVNNKIIKNLEEQIELCSEEILKNNSDTPQCNLREICQFITGYSYKSDELVPSDTALVTIKNFSRNGGFNIDGLKPINASKKIKDQQVVDLFDILVAHTDLTQKAEIVGNAEMVMDLGNYKEAIASMDLVKVVPISDVYPKSIIYCILKSRQFKQHCLGYVNGTTVLHLSKRALPEFSFKITDDKIKIKSISNIAHNSIKLISLLMKSNRILYSIRDTLLPKLLTGEIKLKNQ